VPAAILQIPTLKKLNLAGNNITSLSGDPEESDENSNMADSETWGCTALKVLNLSNNKLEHLPRGIQGALGLTKVLVDNNKLRDFPMPWKCPLVSLLNADEGCMLFLLLSLSLSLFLLLLSLEMETCCHVRLSSH